MKKIMTSVTSLENFEQNRSGNKPESLNNKITGIIMDNERKKNEAMRFIFDASPEQVDEVLQVFYKGEKSRGISYNYTVTEAAKKLGRSPWYFYDRMNRGVLQYYQEPNCPRYIPADVLDTFFGNLTIGVSESNERSIKAREKRMAALEAKKLRNINQQNGQEVLTQDANTTVA